MTTRLAMAGAPALAIKELAGHTSLTTTMRYMHLSPPAKSAAIELLNAEVRGAVEPEKAAGGSKGKSPVIPRRITGLDESGRQDSLTVFWPAARRRP
jgi:hypothetical protein